jgi:hypothetical protein
MNSSNKDLMKNTIKYFHLKEKEGKYFKYILNFWPGCTGANPGYSMVNVGRRAGGEKNFRNSFFSNYLSQPLDIWHTALTHGPILWDLISGLSLIHFLFIHLVKLVRFFDINGQW